MNLDILELPFLAVHHPLWPLWVPMQDRAVLSDDRTKVDHGEPGLRLTKAGEETIYQAEIRREPTVVAWLGIIRT